MTILGIDPGMSCGFAVRREDAAGNISWESGVWTLKGDRYEGAGMPLLRLRRFLSDAIRIIEPTQVAVEMTGGFMPSRAAQFGNYAMCGVVMTVCEELRIPYLTVSPGQVKVVACGKGNADKDAVRAAGEARWPTRRFETSDEIDARYIAETAAHPPEVKRKRKKKGVA